MLNGYRASGFDRRASRNTSWGTEIVQNIQQSMRNYLTRPEDEVYLICISNGIFV